MSENDGSTNNQTTQQTPDNSSSQQASPSQSDQPNRVVEHGQRVRLEYFTKADSNGDSEKKNNN